MFFPFDFFDFIFPIVFIIMFVFIFGMSIYIFIKGIKESRYNNSQPKIPAEVLVVSKQQNIYHRKNRNINSSNSITFEFSNGNRIELIVDPKEYGMIVEGDVGILVSQGNKFISFERI